MAKITRERWKTFQNVFDNFTYKVLDKLISQKYISALIGPVSIGKESNVFSARGKQGKVIVKIYRLEVCDFNKMFEYIRYDPRFVGLQKQKRKVIFAWVQREYRNLMKARSLGIPVPKPITFYFNVLIEEMIGPPARKLKDLPPKNPKEFIGRILEYVKKLYKARFVHGDLSQFNILNHDNMPYLIDFSTMTPRDNPYFLEYVVRDVRNICTYSDKVGLKLNLSEELGRLDKNFKNTP